jgi:alkylhydroperoxidase family enzyme
LEGAFWERWALPVADRFVLALNGYGHMAYSLDQIDWCEVPLLAPMPDPVWERESAKRLGFTSNMASYLTPVRWLLQAEELLRARVTPNVPIELGMLIGLVVAMDNSCRHCYGAFRSVLKIMGYSERMIRRLEESLAVNDLSNKEKAALEFARKVSHSAPRPSEADLRELKAVGYSATQIAEIAYLAANNASGNRLATLLAVPPDPLEEVGANWFEKLKRPFTRKDFQASFSSIFRVDSPPYAGPGAGVVKALEGSPASGALAIVLSGAWESGITSKRVKALIFGVVARGLGCAACEAEAAEALRHEGWKEAEIEHLMTYLTSGKLEPFELKALRFARETVRYQTRRVQELAQNFARGVEREVLLEIVGLVSYANGLARMSILLHQC